MIWPPETTDRSNRKRMRDPANSCMWRGSLFLSVSTFLGMDGAAISSDYWTSPSFDRSYSPRPR